MKKVAASDTLPRLVDVRPLVPYERNTRTHTPEQVEQLKEAFRRFGFIGALAYVPPAALKIGHARRQAAMEMWAAGEDVPTPGRRAVYPKWTLPAIDVTGLDDTELRALVIADNKLALNAGWDEALLAAELKALGELNFDIPLIGFDPRELDRLFNPEPEGKSGGGSMAAEFMIPPFSVLSAREGWWQDRKRAWIGLGIRSEVGRGENLIKRSLQDRLAIIVPGHYRAAVAFIAECREKEMDDAAILAEAVRRWGNETNVALLDDAATHDAIPGGAGKNSAWRKGGRGGGGITFSAGSVSGDGREPGETTGDRVLRGSKGKDRMAPVAVPGGPTGPNSGYTRGRKVEPGLTYGELKPQYSGEGGNLPMPAARPGGLGGVTMQSLSSHPRYYEQKTAAEARVGRTLSNEEFEREHWVMPEDSEIASGTSIFDPVLCELSYRWFSPQGGVVLDPFAGGSVRGIVAAALGRRYVGIDLRQEQVDANRAQWPGVAAKLAETPADDATARPDGAPEPEWLTGDSLLVLPQLDTEVDFLFSCPPYGDLEVYSDDPADLSTLDADEFDRLYAEIIGLAVAKLRPDRFATFVVGDYRDRRGLYRNFVSKTIAAFEAAGARLYNEAILVTSVGSLPIRAAKQFRTTRKLGKTHQNILTFVKGDPRKATAACGPVDVSSALAELEPADED